MGVCMSIDENTLRIQCGSEVRGRRQAQKRIIMEVLNAEARAFQLLCQMPGRICANGATSASCIFSKQGRKGINQDCMLVWEEFAALPNTVLCAVFDGHGPRGHLVARKVRDSLPLLLALPLNSLSNLDTYPVCDGGNKITAVEEGEGNKEAMERSNRSEPEVLEQKKEAMERSTILEPEVVVGNKVEALERSSITEPEAREIWKKKLVAAYEIMDQNLKTHPKLNSFCSGTTAVTMIVQDKDVVIGNVGDSRAVLARRSGEGSLVADQLTVDLKPNLPGELERIRRCKGRVFALEDEPGVARVWQPHIDTPGLAMARALGDFCLKEYGLSAVPDVSHRRLTEEDEFIVLATDGVWDVLTNDDVVGIVSSAFSKETAAKCVVEAAVKSWKRKYAAVRTDDCAVVCYFLKEKLTPSIATIRSVSKSNGQANLVEYSVVDVVDDSMEIDMEMDPSVAESNSGFVAYDRILTGNVIDSHTIILAGIKEGDSPQKHMDRGV